MAVQTHESMPPLSSTIALEQFVMLSPASTFLLSCSSAWGAWHKGNPLLENILRYRKATLPKWHPAPVTRTRNRSDNPGNRRQLWNSGSRQLLKYFDALAALGFLQHEFHRRVACWVRARAARGTPELATCSIAALGFARLLA